MKKETFQNIDRVLVVMPTYNEYGNIEKTVTATLMSEERCDVLVVDDASPDGTGNLADELSSRFLNRVTVLHRSGKQGLGSAYMDGFTEGVRRGYGMLCEMDADGSHNPSDLPRLIDIVRGGADVAIGSRRIPGGGVMGWGPHRHLMSWAAMSFARFILCLKTRDVTSGFRCYRLEVAKMLIDSNVQSNGYAFQEETLFLCERKGYRVKEVPIMFKNRVSGMSKLSFRDVGEFFLTIVRLRGHRIISRGGNETL